MSFQFTTQSPSTIYKAKAPKVEYEVLLLQFLDSIIVTLEEAQDGHVTQGVGGGVEIVRNWKVLSFVANRAQVLYKVVTEPPLGLTNVEEAISGAVDAIDHIDGYAGEPLSDVKCLFGSLDGGEGGGVECPILGADAEELGVGDHILAGRWVRGGLVQVGMGVGGLEIDVSLKAVTRDDPGELEIVVKG
eukprot:g33099.t1